MNETGKQKKTQNSTIFILFYKLEHLKTKEDDQEVTKLMELYNAGRINEGQFLSQVAEISNMTVEQVRKELDNNRANLELFEYIDELKAKGYKNRNAQ